VLHRGAPSAPSGMLSANSGVRRPGRLGLGFLFFRRHRWASLDLSVPVDFSISILVSHIHYHAHICVRTEVYHCLIYLV
jgi:hypothetical protein